MVRPFLALYAGGMGARGANFHFEVFARMGYEDVATKVQELYLEGKKAEAAAAIPLAMVEDVALVGPPDKIRGELDRWRETCITTFLVGGPPRSCRSTPSPSSADPTLGQRSRRPALLLRSCEPACTPRRRPRGRDRAAETRRER